MGIALLVSLIMRTGAGTVIEHAKAVGWGMVLILALGGISHLLRTYAWRLSFRSDIRSLSLARTFGLRLISEAIGNFGLAGQVVGDSMRISLLGPAIPIADRISSVAFDRGIYIVSAALLSVSAMLACVSVLPLPGAWRLYALLFAAAMTIVVGLALLGFARRWRLASAAAHAVQRLPLAKKWLTGKVSVIESAEDNLLTFRSQAPRSFWIATVLYVGSQVLAVAEVYLLLRFMGVRITSIGALVIEGFTKLISIVGAVNPGNIGTYEGGNLVLAHLLGFSAASGLTLALCRRARTLFWAGIGALCLVVLSRGNEQSKPESEEGSQPGGAPESQAAGEMYAKNLTDRSAPAVIIMVESAADDGAFVPALARVGALPVLLRAILSAEQIFRPARMVVSLPSSAARAARDMLSRTGRLPRSVEWHEISGNDLGGLLRELATTADRIVLLSGTTIYKPTLLQTLCERKPTNVVFKADAELVGIYAMSRAAALQFANESNAHAADLSSWMAANFCAAVAPASREDWQGIATPEDVRAAEQKVDTWMFKPTDGRFARFNRRISIPISRQLIKTPIRPNAVTFIILAVSVAAGVFFARGGYWNMLAGALLSVWASILDGCDGEVARFKLQSSKFGCWLDTLCDYLYYLMTFCGIAWGLNRGSSTNIYLAWGAVLSIGMLLSFVVVSGLRRRMAASQPDKFLALFQSKAEARSSNPLLFLARNTEFIIRRCFFPYALLVAALLNIIKPVFIITAISANLVWTIALYSSFALSRNATASGRSQPRMEPDAIFNAPS
jgi:phosphatidylglycerophosphate synthase